MDVLTDQRPSPAGILTYLIALCDDEKKELDRTERMLRDYASEHAGLHFELSSFESAEKLLESIEAGRLSPDLILMDIYMQGRTGIEAVRELRGLGSTCKIIFVTNSVEHALDAFQVDAAQYLVKPLSRKALSALLDKILTDMEQEQSRYVLLREGSRLNRVAVCDIVYCEAQRKCQHVYLTDGTQFDLHMSMAWLKELFTDFREIVRLGNSFIVNLRHIRSINRQELEMDNGKKIYLPRGSYHPLSEQYIDYYCEGKG